MAERDWANFSEDEDDDHDEPQQQPQIPQEKTQEEYYMEAYAEDLKAYNQGEETNNSGYGGYSGYGGRGRGGGRGGRGGGRGRGRGGRGGGRGEGPREGQRPPRQIKENQPKQEMINLIKRGKDESTFINLFDVDFKATEEDMRGVYPEVKIDEVTMIKPGLFLLELNTDEALKLIDIGPKKFNQRDFYMKLGYSNKRQHQDEQWQAGNQHRFEAGNREDRPQRGGKHHYNRREQNQYGDESSPKPRYNNNRDNRDRDFKDKRGSDQPDTNNKFFQGHDLGASEFKIKFTNSSTKKDEEPSTTPQPKPVKPNPFGDAVARDESMYLKKKEEERKQVKDLQEHFEEKKEQQQLPKEPKLKLTAPVNSVDSQNLEPAVEKAAEKDEKKGEYQQRPRYEDKGRYNQGNQYGKDYGKDYGRGGYKKSGFEGGKGQAAYEPKGRDNKYNDYPEDDRQNRGQGERWQQKDKGFTNNKFNKFDALK